VAVDGAPRFSSTRVVWGQTPNCRGLTPHAGVECSGAVNGQDPRTGFLKPLVMIQSPFAAPMMQEV